MSSSINYPSDDSSYAAWQDYLDNTIRPHIDAMMKAHHVFEAIQYVTTTLLTFLGNFTEDHQMAGQAKIENVLSQLQDLRNRIQNDFNTMQSATGSTAEAAAMDAYHAYFGGTLSDGTTTAGIKSILETNETVDPKNPKMFDQTFVNSVEQEFAANSSGTQGPIFGTNTPSNDPHGDNLVSYWQKMWGSNNPDDPNSTQPVTNALTSVASDFSSQNSTAESRIKFYEANDEQYKSMTHSMMTEIINEEKQSTTATQSAGS